MILDVEDCVGIHGVWIDFIDMSSAVGEIFGDRAPYVRTVVVNAAIVIFEGILRGDGGICDARAVRAEDNQMSEAGSCCVVSAVDRFIVLNRCFGVSGVMDSCWHRDRYNK